MTFAEAHEFVERWEGGFVDDKMDPGGATKWGITLRTILSRGLDFNNDGVIDRRDILDMTPEQARQVYMKDYWLGSSADKLPGALALVHYDCAVNQGVKRSAQILQQAVGAKVDYAIGPRTLALVVAEWNRDPKALLAEYCARRAVHYSSLAIVTRFGLGWYRRLFAVHSAALAALVPS